MLEQLTIQVTKTSDGLRDYVQISSPAAIPVNIVLVAGTITVDDRRQPKENTRRNARAKSPKLSA